MDVISLASFSYQLNALTGGAAELTEAITELLQETEKRVFQQFPYHKLPFSAGAKRFDRAKATIAAALTQIIDEKKRLLMQEKDSEGPRAPHIDHQDVEGEHHDDRLDVLDRLLRVVDPVLSDEQLLDEAMVI